MFRNAGLKTSYKEKAHFGNTYVVEWDKQPIMVNDYAIDEEGNIIYDEDGNPVVVGQHEDPNFCSWMQESFIIKPSLDEIKTMVLANINEETDSKILSGFTWTSPEGTAIPVYLSSENQFNYKAAYDLAYQTNGASLPFVLKFGAADNPQYYTFNDIQTFSDFYLSCIAFINATLQEGWVKKDSIDWTKYDFDNSNSNQ